MTEFVTSHWFAYLPVIALAVPLIGAILIPICGEKRRNLREATSIITAIILFGVVVSILSLHIGGENIDLQLVEVVPPVTIRFTIEPLGLLFALIASFLWIATSIYSIGYMRGNKEEHQSRFYCFFALSLMGAIGIAFSGNLFTLFLFYELLTLVTYPLVTHSQSREAKKSGRLYIGILIGTSIAFLFTAIIWTWLLTGTVDFVEGGILGGKVSGTITGILLLLYMYGIGKAALMPIHRWLPAAMVAPTPVSALLHAVAVVKAGVFSVVKVIVYIFGIDNLRELVAENPWHGDWLVYIAGITVLLSSIVALRQDNLKLRLAYSTISQLSYVVIAAALFTVNGIIGASLHIAAHAFGKITLFFGAGSIATMLHKKKVSELSGVGKIMPFTMGAFTIGALSMIGLPLTGGFVSKWYMLLGSIEVKHYFVMGVIILSTILNAGYYLPIIYKAFFEDDPKKKAPKHGQIEIKESIPIAIAMSISALGTLLLFFFATPVYNFISRIV